MFKVEVKFSPRELEFIKLKYGEELQMKAVCELMHITRRTYIFYNSCVASRLGLNAMDGDQGSAVQNAIKVTKILLKAGVIK